MDDTAEGSALARPFARSSQQGARDAQDAQDMDDLLSAGSFEHNGAIAGCVDDATVAGELGGSSKRLVLLRDPATDALPVLAAQSTERRFSPRGDAHRPTLTETSAQRGAVRSDFSSTNSAGQRSHKLSATSAHSLSELTSNVSRASSMGVDRLFSEDRQVRLTVIERTVDWTVRTANRFRDSDRSDNGGIELKDITAEDGQSPKASEKRNEDDRRLLPWLVILPHGVLKKLVFVLYIVSALSMLFYWFSEPVHERNTPETFIGQMSEDKKHMSWLLNQTRYQDIFDKYVAFEMTTDLARALANDPDASLLYFKETDVHVKLHGNCFDVVSNARIAGDYTTRKLNVVYSNTWPYRDCQVECAGEGTKYFVWYEEDNGQRICECHEYLNTTVYPDGLIEEDGTYSGASDDCCQSGTCQVPGFCSLEAVHHRPEKQYTVLVDQHAVLSTGLIGLLQNDCLTHSYKLEIATLQEFNIPSDEPDPQHLNVSVFWYDKEQELSFLWEIRQFYMPILILALFIGLFSAGQRVSWKWGKMPLGFWPTILQVLSAILQANPAVFYSTFGSLASFGQLERSAIWRLVVRGEVLLYCLCFSLYISNLYRSLKPREKWKGIVVGETFFNILHVVLLMVLYHMLASDTSFLGVSSRAVSLFNYLLACWFLVFLNVLITGYRYARLMRLLHSLPYSRCWLQVQVKSFLLLLFNVQVMSTFGVRAVRMILHGSTTYTATTIGPIRLSSVWKALHMFSAGMILEHTTFHTDILTTTVYTTLAIVSLVVFAPRPPQDTETNDGQFTLKDKFGNKRRFPPYMSAKEIKRIRWLTHASRVINKIETVFKEGGMANVNNLVKEPYDTEQTIRNYFTSLKIVKKPVKNDKFDVLGAVLEGQFQKRRVLIVTFRGTKGSKNVKQDLKAVTEPLDDPERDGWYKTFVNGRHFDDASASRDLGDSAVRVADYEGVMVHSGFQESLDSVKDELMNIVRGKLELMLKHNRKVDIWLVGHSFGGALATLLAVKVHALLQVLDKDRQHCTAGVFTLGAPRVGNGKLARFFRKMEIKVARVINEGDPIPSMPPSIFGFKHVGSLIWMSKYGHLRKDPSFLEISLRSHLNISGLFLYLPSSFLSIGSVASSHKLAAYMSGLEVAEIKESDGASFDPTRSRFAGHDLTQEAENWVLDEDVDGHEVGETVDLPDEHVALGDRALAAVWGYPSVLFRRAIQGGMHEDSMELAEEEVVATASGQSVVSDVGSMPSHPHPPVQLTLPQGP